MIFLVSLCGLGGTNLNDRGCIRTKARCCCPVANVLTFTAVAPESPAVAYRGSLGFTGSVVDGYCANTSAISLSLKRGNWPRSQNSKSSSVLMPVITNEAASLELLYVPCQRGRWICDEESLTPVSNLNPLTACLAASCSVGRC